jgi:DNA-binding NarL/FixJ family response regulator
VKPVLIVVEPKAHRRLKLVASLRETFQVEPLLSLDSALRQIRSVRPAVVLIGLGRRPAPGTRLARQIKTDANTTAMVGLIDWSGRLENPEACIRDTGSDGLFHGTPSATQAQAFVDALNASTPSIHGEPKAGLFRRRS